MTMASSFGHFMDMALQHPDGPRVVGTFDRTFQFDLTDDAPFYMELRGGNVLVREGDSGLDWRYRDWERATCVHTSARVLREILAGTYLASDAYFDRELGFSSRRRANRTTDGKAMMSWFYALLQLGLEQGRATAYAQLASEL